MIADHLLSDRIVSVIGISDLDIIWDLGFKLVFREANYFLPESVRTYYDVTLLDILARKRHQPVHHHAGEPGDIFRREDSTDGAVK